MVAIQASPADAPAYLYANINGAGSNATLKTHNASSSFFPTTSSAPSSPSPVSGKLGAGLGAALGFAAVVILLVLYHIFKAQRQRRLQQRRQRAVFGARAGRDEEQQRSLGRQQPMVQQIPAEVHLSSSSRSSLTEKSRQKGAVVTTTICVDEESVPRYERGRGLGRATLGRSISGGSLWERGDGHGLMPTRSADTIDGKWTAVSSAETVRERPKFSFEDVVESEDSIESISRARVASQAKDAAKANGGEPKDMGEQDLTLEKGEKARHVLEMEPY